MAPHKHHLAGPLIYQVFRDTNSLQLHAPFDAKEQDLAGQRSECHQTGRREEKLAKRVRQFLNILVGVSVGVAAALIRIGCQWLGDWRRGLLLQSIFRADLDTAFLATVLAGISLTAGFAVLATCAVVWRTASSGSGIPGVLAFLNGVDLRGALSGSVLLAKAFGTIFAVGGGLAVGPEGPMVHIGANVGMVVVRRFVAPALRRMGPLGRRLEIELLRQPLRYHVQAAAMGAGAGIAAAFNAPVAGTVFVVEEAASFFSKRLILHSFITCAVASATADYVAWLIAGVGPESVYARTSGCLADVKWTFWLGVHIVVVGVVCGLLAVLFNRVVVTVSANFALQALRLGRGRKLFLWRFGYATAVGALCGCFVVCMPRIGGCREASLQNAFAGGSGCIYDSWLRQLVEGSQSVNTSHMPELFQGDGPRTMAYKPSPGLFGAQYDPIICPRALALVPDCQIKGIEDILKNYSDLSRWANLHATSYCCGFLDWDALRRGEFFDVSQPKAPLDMGADQWPQAQCQGAAWDVSKNISIDHYSPGAALTLVSPTDAVKNLLTRGAPGVLPWQTVACFFVGYFFLAAMSATAWVPGGLLVPMMAIGAAAGRLYGMAWHSALGQFSQSPFDAIPWIPELQPLLDLLYPKSSGGRHMSIEPGILALAGCAAFLSGSGSLVMFVVVLLIEITLEPFLIPVILLAILAARTTVSLLGAHGLYHELMHVQSLPFLPETGHWRQGHYVIADLLQEDARRVRLFEAAESQNITPAEVEAPDWWQREEPGLPPVITVSRRATFSEVGSVLERRIPGDDKPTVNGFPVVEPGEGGGQLCGLVSREALLGLLAEEGASEVLPSETPSSRGMQMTHPLTGGAALQLGLAVAGVERVMDSAPFVLQASAPVLHAHMLFARCGLRHVVVVDSGHKPIGVLTRKSLMPWRIPGLDEENLHHDTFLEQREAHSPTASPGHSPRSLSHQGTPRIPSRAGSRAGSRSNSRIEVGMEVDSARNVQEPLSPLQESVRFTTVEASVNGPEPTESEV